MKQEISNQKEQHKSLLKGISIMLVSSLLSCVGQLIWKLSAIENTLLFLLIGTLCYGLGALLMIIAMKFGELSILHPMLSFGFIFSLVMGATILGEEITFWKVGGVLLIVLGIILLAFSGIKEAAK